MHAKILKMPYGSLLKQVLIRPALYGLILTPVLYSLASWMPGGDSWLHLLCAGTLATMVAGACSLALLSQQEMFFVKDKAISLVGKTRKNIT